MRARGLGLTPSTILKRTACAAALPLLLLAACDSPTDDATAATRQNSSAIAPRAGVSTSIEQVPQADLKSAVGSSSAQSFYEQAGWSAVWSGEAEQELRQALSDRARHGLDQVAFLDVQGNSPAEREAALTNAALAYAAALGRGLVDPADLHDIYSVPRPDSNVASGLSSALQNGRVGQWLASLAPQDREYKALSDAYLRMQQVADSERNITVPGGDLIRQGDTDSRLPQIARVLARDGYLNRAGYSAQDGSGAYDSRVEQAIRKLQEDRGIHVDGVIGPETVQALNTGADDRARAAAVALERRRWLERNAPSTRIDVNTAAAKLEYVRDGQLADRRDVIVGQPGWETPQLGTSFYRLVANPNWTVPKSIERDEGLANKSASYLRSKNMVRRDGWVVQLPGPDNALGMVKFDLDNDHAIYLHDTAAKSLFSEDVRQLSHGCIRVENALEFASMIARDTGITGKWQDARQEGGETYLRLPDPIPVRLMYHPTHLDASGEIRFVQDIYDWNGPVAEKLGFGRGTADRRIAKVEDIGP